MFLGYAWFYVGFHEAALRLEAVLSRHPNWIVPRAVLAGAWEHAAIIQQNEAFARKALAEIPAPMYLAPDNPFVLAHGLGVYNGVSKVLGEDDERDRIADEIADKLSLYPKYSVGTLLRAVYYERVKQPAKALGAWQELLEHGQGIVAFWAAAELFRHGDAKAVLKAQGKGPELEIAQAYLRAVTGNPNDRKIALKTFERLLPDCKTWLLRHQLIQIPLLLKEPGLAQQQCQTWLKDAKGEEGFDDENRFDKESIQFLARNMEGQSFDPESSDPQERFYANYQRAFLELSNGYRKDAVKRFQSCDDVFRALYLKCWARAFGKHFANDSSTSDGVD